MPSKYIVRNFSNGSYFHIANRGIDNRHIFLDDEDRNLFLYYVYIYLTPLDKVLRRYHNLPLRLFQKNVAKDVELLAYTLMPDHFHLILKQKGDQGISQFMKQIANAYTQYFNQKYQRKGSLFEGPFKAVSIPNNESLMHLSRYLHLDPVITGLTSGPEYPWSSYHEYADVPVHRLCTTRTILSLFPSVYAYKRYVHDRKDALKKMGEIKPLLME